MIFENIAENIINNKTTKQEVAARLRDFVYEYQSKMVLRDSFAKAALTGLLTEANGDYADGAIADLAYNLAEAMMKSRKETK